MKPMELSENKINIAIASSGLTLTEIAERSGYSKQRFSNILNQRRVSPQTAGKVARGLGVDVREIIETENTAK